MASFAPLASGQYIFPGEMHTFQVVPFANLERGANPSMKPPFSFLLSPFYLSSAARFIKGYRESGTEDVLHLMASEARSVGIVDPFEVRVFAAHLLAEGDPTLHNWAKYVLNGPEDITGRQTVSMVSITAHWYVDRESELQGHVVCHSLYKLQYAATTCSQSRNAIGSINYAAETAWKGKFSAVTTSREFLPRDVCTNLKRTPADVLKSLLEGYWESLLAHG